MCLTFLYGGRQQPEQRGFNKEIDMLEEGEVLKCEGKFHRGHLKGTAHFHIYVTHHMGVYENESQGKVIKV